MSIMPNIRFGCQTFTWEMNGRRSATPEAMVEAMAGAGYSGIEITDRMIGDFVDRPAAFAALLERFGLDLVAYTFSSPTGFTDAAAKERDIALIDEAIAFTAHFPGTRLTLGSATAFGNAGKAEMFAVAADLYNIAGRKGQEAGIEIGIHASSHEHTLLFSEADYEMILDLTDPSMVGWVPDTGHMLRGGHDLLGMLERHAARINYLHVKDIDSAGQWAMLGEGVTDMKALTEFVTANLPPNSWIIMEEESDRAARDPAAAITQNYRTLRNVLSQS